MRFGKKLLMKLLLASLGMVAASGHAQIVQPGISYSGQVRLNFPNAGVSFVLPAGWKGALPSGKGVFLMGNNTIAGIGVVGTKIKSASAVLNEMRKPVPFLLNTRLILAGSVQRKGNTLFGLYRVQGAQKPMAAYVVSVFGRNGRVVTFVVAANQARIQQLARDVQLMMASTTIKTGTAVVPPNAAGGVNTNNSPLARLLSGLKLTYMKTGSYTRTKINLYLCKNGTFYRRTNYGGVDNNFSIAGRNASQGRWSMQGNQGFVLRFNNGSVVNMRVTFQGSKLFLNGVRYFRNGSAGC